MNHLIKYKLFESNNKTKNLKVNEIELTIGEILLDLNDAGYETKIESSEDDGVFVIYITINPNEQNPKKLCDEIKIGTNFYETMKRVEDYIKSNEWRLHYQKIPTYEFNTYICVFSNWYGSLSNRILGI